MRIGLIGTAFRRDNPTAIPDELARVVAAGTEPRIYQPGLSAFPHNPFDLKLQEIGYLEAGLRAARDSCSALVINTVGDYGLAALRSAVRVPVVGAGQASFLVAASLGLPFAIVTIWPQSTGFLYRQILRDTGTEALCAAVLHVGQEAELAGVGEADDYIAQMQRGDASLLDRVLQLCGTAVQQHGATVIVLGCTCMSPIAHRIAGRLDVPVINPLTTAVKYAEMLHGLELQQSRSVYAHANPARHEAIAAAAAAAAPLVGEEACEICVASAST